MYFKHKNPTFTGNLWLDGIIWSMGAKESKNKIHINMSNLPYPLIREIMDSFEDLEYETDLYEIPIKVRREKELFMHVISPATIFEELPPFRERRILKIHPKKFIEGFLIVRLRVFKKRRGDLSYTLRLTSIGIRENIEDALIYLGVKYKIQHGTIEIQPNSYKMLPFNKYLSLLEKEKMELFGGEPDEDAILSELVNEITSRKKLKKK